VKRCLNCRARRAVSKGRCATCYRFWIRNGYDRPESLIVRNGRRACERRDEVRVLRGMMA
jgi:hypothetical protein